MWFSVKENLPLPNTKVLTYSPELGEGAHRIMETNNGKFYAMVTHWIPLPVPPTAEELGVAALQTTNSRYVALAQAWRKLADDSSDARYSAVLYGCADDLCQLNAEK